MKAETLAHFPMTWLTCVALVIFFVVFATMVMRAFKKSNVELYRRMERLPLHEEGERHERQ